MYIFCINSRYCKSKFICKKSKSTLLVEMKIHVVHVRAFLIFAIFQSVCFCIYVYTLMSMRSCKFKFLYIVGIYLKIDLVSYPARAEGSVNMIVGIYYVYKPGKPALSVASRIFFLNYSMSKSEK